MTTTIYLVDSITPSGGSFFKYSLDLATTFSGDFSAGDGATTDGDALFEDGEVFFYTVNGTVYEVTYDGFADLNASGTGDLGVFTFTSVVSGSDTDGLDGLQFAYTVDGSTPSTQTNGDALDPAIGSTIPGWVCFAAGTLIKTAFGEVPVEKLKVGDLVETQDDGLQKIRWTGARKLPLKKGAILATTPVRIAANAFGAGMPSSELLVSPQHRILVQGAAAELLFGEPEVLVPAKHLVDGKDITYASDLGTVDYVHIMFDTHQIVTSNGLNSESFHPGAVGLGNIDRAAKTEMLRIFPELGADTAAYGPTVRLTIKAHQAAVLMELRANTQTHRSAY